MEYKVLVVRLQNYQKKEVLLNFLFIPVQNIQIQIRCMCLEYIKCSLLNQAEEGMKWMLTRSNMLTKGCDTRSLDFSGKNQLSYCCSHQSVVLVVVSCSLQTAVWSQQHTPRAGTFKYCFLLLQTYCSGMPLVCRIKTALVRQWTL